MWREWINGEEIKRVVVDELIVYVMLEGVGGEERIILKAKKINKKI